ncbi:MAG: SCP2 sterol-binding domain-containing protein [Oceanospirillaceae bacterium]|nr:SCP2 sterol-binding domain-containing protein [Oceanospirillaceae bacterium]
MINLDDLFQQMQQRFNAQAAQNIEAVFQYNLSEQQIFSCKISDGECSFSEGAHSAPDIELSMASDLLLEIISGESDAMQAFMEGSIEAEGDMTLAPALVSLFPAA